MNKDIPWPLIIGRLKNELGEEDKKRFDDWLLADDNRRLYRELSALWEKIREASSSYTPDTAYYWQQLEARMKRTAPRPRTVSLRRFRLALTAASVLLAITLSLSFLYVSRAERSPVPAKSVYAALNGKSRLVLPDNSVVWLHAGSTLEYASDFKRRRTVNLQGEALFEVTKDDRYPFVVSAADMQVKVHGTRFHVSSYPKETGAQVTLFHGSVSVNAAGGETLLHPGQTARLDRPSQTLAVAPADLSFEACWAHESIRFEGKPIRYIARYLEEWYHVSITIDPSVPDTQGYTFTLRDESVEAILRMMARLNPIGYTFDANDHVHITYVKPAKKKMPMK